MLTEVGTFVRPVLVTAPPGDMRRIFVVEHAGRVQIIRDDVVLPTPFLDIRDRVMNVNEPGFQSIAFAPDYEDERARVRALQPAPGQRRPAARGVHGRGGQP